MTATRKIDVAPPPLENGDRLTREEFEIRYEAMPRLKKAELIEGVVYFATSVRASHGEAHGTLATLLGVFSAYTSGIFIADNSTVRLDENNEPQPDVLMCIDADKGGSARIDEDDFIAGAPELILEIATSDSAYDLYDKKEAYRHNGVQEYVVWTARERSLSWFALSSDEYIALEPDESGIIRSRVFPGLWLNVDAFVAGDLALVYETLQNGIADKSHQAFVKKLSQG